MATRKRGGPGRRAPRGRARDRSKDPLDEDFGPGPQASESRGTEAGAVPGGRGGSSASPGRRGDEEGRAPHGGPGGPLPGIACAGEGCVLKPVADLVGKFTLRVARGHGSSLFRAAYSGIELMKALRDFLDEEITLAERAAGKAAGGESRYVKISVD